MGAEIPDGVLAFKSKHKPMSLSELEQLILLSVMGGVTGWHFAIMRNKKYAPFLSIIVTVHLVELFPLLLDLLHRIFFTEMIKVRTSFPQEIFIQHKIS
jgi:hypothetical protein